MTTTYTLNYFDVRGRAEPIRLLMAYAGITFEDRGVSGDDWAKLKPESPLGQLPFLVEQDSDGVRVIPQTMAIMRHLAREYGLDGKTEAERLAADVACETAVDARNAFSALRYSPAWSDETAKAKFASETAPVHLGRIDKLLGAREWLASSAPTYADIYVFDALDRLVSIWPSLLSDWPRLASLHKRVEALPELKRYLATRRPA